MHRTKQRNVLCLFDHRVGTGQKRKRDFEFEHLCGLEIDRELELDWGLDREVARLVALQYSINIRCGAPILLDKVWTIRDQSANFCEGPGPIDSRDTVASSQFRNLCEMVLCEGIGYHD